MSNEIKTTDQEIQINGKVYVPKDAQNNSPNYLGDIRIVILQRGWVYIGRFSRDGNLCQLKNASCIRQWGTTKGLQELVNGPTSKTILDKCDGVIEFDWLTVIHTISVNESLWKQM